jgi:hypothetical protein
VAHPGNHGSLGSLFDRNAFCPGHCSTSNRGGVIRDSPCHSVGKIGVTRMKGQERPHRPQEVLDVIGLGLVTASGVGLLLFGETLGRSFGVEIGTNPVDGRCRCLNAPGEDLAALPFGNDPMISSGLYPACQSSGFKNKSSRPGMMSSGVASAFTVPMNSSFRMFTLPRYRRSAICSFADFRPSFSCISLRKTGVSLSGRTTLVRSDSSVSPR